LILNFLFIFRIDVQQNDLKAQIATDRVPSLLLIPNYSIGKNKKSSSIETVIFDPIKNSFDAKEILNFILENSQNFKTIESFIIQNYLTTSNETMKQKSKLRYNLINSISSKIDNCNRNMNRINNNVNSLDKVFTSDNHSQTNDDDYFKDIKKSLLKQLDKYKNEIKYLKNFLNLIEKKQN
jgi:DNA repair exonuclease SbcCD nuclease subunit